MLAIVSTNVRYILKTKKTGDVIAGKIVVYTGEHDQYVSLITPEAWFSLEEWINYRKQHGNKITPESMLMRDPILLLV